MLLIRFSVNWVFEFGGSIETFHFRPKSIRTLTVILTKTKMMKIQGERNIQQLFYWEP